MHARLHLKQAIWRRRAIWLTLAAAIAAGPASPCHADPQDTDPAASSLDPDYAAGRKALDSKNWNAAIKSLSSAARATRTTPTSRTTWASPIAKAASSTSRSNTTSRLFARPTAPRRARIHRRSLSHERRPEERREAPQSAARDLFTDVRRTHRSRARHRKPRQQKRP